MVVAANAPVVAVLTRAPSAGGKSRLFAALGRPADPALLAALLLDTLEGAAVPGVRRIVAVTPGTACAEVREIVRDVASGVPDVASGVPDVAYGLSRKLLLHVDVIAQPDGDLGERMQATMAAVIAHGAPAVALIGSDLPHIPPGAIAEAFALVAQDRDALVLGPAADGGYYLIAARRVPDVFAGIEWGSAQVLAQTERAAAADGFRVRRLATLADVDGIEDLRRALQSGRATRTVLWARAHAPYLLR